MKFRRQFLLSALLAVAFSGTSAQAQDNVLRVGTDATFPPMEFVEKDKRTGFDIELVEAMGKAMGKRVEWVDIDFKGLIPGLVAKRFDVAVSAIYITDERKKVFDFSEPYFDSGVQMAVTKNEVEKNQEMFNLVEIGRADAAVTGKPAAAQYVRTRPGLRVLSQQLTTEEYGMALRKDTPDLTKAMNGALAKVKADGMYAALVKKCLVVRVLKKHSLHLRQR